MNTGTLTLTPRERWAILYRDGFTCRYCGAKAPEARLHVDHVIARSNGGTNHQNNLVTACEPCNAGKGASELPPHWQWAYEQSVAGAAIEALLERFTTEPTALMIWEVLQICLSGKFNHHVTRLIRSSDSLDDLIELMSSEPDDSEAQQ